MHPKKLYSELLKQYGEQGWWPTKAEGYHKSNKKRKLTEKEMVEICVGAILTQNTSWKNVEKAIDNLHSENLVDLRKLAETSRKKLAKIIRPSGYYNQKAEYLQLFAGFVLAGYGTLAKMFSTPVPELRAKLLNEKGLGPETADSMLLYAGQKPVFVVDLYTKRLCVKLGICGEKTKYKDLQEVFHKKLPRNAQLYNEMHALIVEHMKNAKF